MNIWKIIYVNCWVENYMKEDHHSYIRNFWSCEKKAWKKFRLVRCTGIAEVKGSNPVQAWIFFRLSFRNCKSCVYNCDDLPSYKKFIFLRKIWQNTIYPGSKLKKIKAHLSHRPKRPGLIPVFLAGNMPRRTATSPWKGC